MSVVCKTANLAFLSLRMTVLRVVEHMR